MSGIARLGDKTFGTCKHPSHDSPITIGGTIITASGNSMTNSKGIARLGDLVRTDCGHTDRIITASPDSNVNSRPIARLGDKVGGDGVYDATIITASPDGTVNG